MSLTFSILSYSLEFSPKIAITVSDCYFFLAFSSSSSSSSLSPVKTSDISFSDGFDSNGGNNSSSSDRQNPRGKWRGRFRSISVTNTRSNWNLAPTHATSISFISFPIPSTSGDGSSDSFDINSIEVLNSSLTVISSSSTNTAVAPDVSFVSTKTLVAASSSPSAATNSLVISRLFRFSNNHLSVSGSLADNSSHVSFLLVRNGTSFEASTSFVVNASSSITSFVRPTISSQFIRVEPGAALIRLAKVSASGDGFESAVLDELSINLKRLSSAPANGQPTVLPRSPFVAILSLGGQAPKEGSAVVSDITISMPPAPPSTSTLVGGAETYKFFVFGSLLSSSSSPGSATTFHHYSHLYWRFERISVSHSDSGQVRVENDDDNDRFISVFGFHDDGHAQYLDAGLNTTFAFVNFSWGCDPVQRQARRLLAAAPNYASTFSSILDGCTFTDPPRSSSFASDFKEGAAAFFSTAIVSAASMSAVAFGLSRSQEVGEFVALTATGRCVAANTSDVPIFSDSPLGINLPDAFCGYAGGAVVGNFALFAVASAISIFFGALGTCVKRKGWGTAYRVLNTGYYGVVISTSIGLFLTPVIQHAALCAARPGGHLAVRIFSGIIAAALFVGVPLWVFFALIRSEIYTKGILVDEHNKSRPSCCRRALSATWNWCFGVRVWKFRAKGGYLSKFMLYKKDDKYYKNNNDSNNENDNDSSSFSPKNGSALVAFHHTIDEAVAAGDDTEVLLEQKFKALRPLFEDYDETFPTFFLYEVLTNSLLGVPSLIAEVVASSHTSDASKSACWSWGVPIAIILFFYWILIIIKRPIQCRVILLANVAVSGLQLLVTVLALYTISLGPQSAPSWGHNIDTALVVAQAALSLVGVFLALRGAWNGGLAKLKNCFCPREEDDDDAVVGAVLRQQSTAFFHDERLLQEMAILARAEDGGHNKNDNSEKKINANNSDKEKNDSPSSNAASAAVVDDDLELNLNVDDSDDINTPPSRQQDSDHPPDDLL